jgi:hypothetical protein
LVGPGATSGASRTTSIERRRDSSIQSVTASTNSVQRTGGWAISFSSCANVRLEERPRLATCPVQQDALVGLADVEQIAQLLGVGPEHNAETRATVTREIAHHQA